MDLIYQSRKLEELKLKLIRNCPKFNLTDAFKVIEPRGPSRGWIAAFELYERLMLLGMAPNRISMDRLNLFYKRFNLNDDD